MSELSTICRICLSVDRKTYDIGKCNLSDIYEFLSGIQVLDFPFLTEVCYECAILMKKVIGIKIKCIKANEILNRIVKKKLEISKSAILKYTTIESNLDFWNESKHSFKREYHKRSSRRHNKRCANSKKFHIDHIEIPEYFEFELTNTEDMVTNESKQNFSTVSPKVVSNLKIDMAPSNLENHKQSEDIVKQEIEEDTDLYSISDYIEVPVDFENSESDTEWKKAKKPQRTKPTKELRKRLLRKILNRNSDKRNRRDVEMLRKLDKRFKDTDEIDNEFVVERFLTAEEQRAEFEKRRFSENYTGSRYKCEPCLKGFREQKLFDIHNKKHERSSGDYLCEICQVRLPTAKRFRTHRDGNHTAKYSCRRCSFVTFNKAQARNHYTWHQGVEHKCPHCDMAFRKYTTFMGHLRLNHPSKHICSTCAHSFVSPYGLHLHRKVVHKGEAPVEKNSEKSYCPDCDVRFDNTQIYTKHLLISPKHNDLAKNIIGCRECGQEFDSRQDLKRHTHKNSNDEDKHKKDAKDFKCSECGQRFSHPTSTYQHFIKAHPHTPYKVARARPGHCLCDQCGKTFMCQSKLLAHKRLHTGERPYECAQCSKAFRTKVYLTKHMNSHDGLRLHDCKVCGKSFTNAGNLFKHMRIHAGVKPFKCELCSKAFVDSSNLRQHIQGVHYNVKRTRKR